ncbi:MAG: tRNA 2-thiouridine(34) synthase MnmA [Bacteroidaceae bacterium]|nr:tRNA 2-thiouridine(34) synthase MnmA [Bacteroidaceae bacterium]
MRTALLLSGGVDSAVALHLLMEQGVNPDLYYIKIGMDGDADLTCTAEEDLEMCRSLARRYGRPLEIVDLQKEYWERVVAYTMERVRKGLTPNPDVMCNRLIKFGAFEEKVGHAYHRTATGHYARLLEENSFRFLATAPDPVKDQTDFLAQLEDWQMQKIMLPIGHLMKTQVREIARQQHLAPASRKDSQGICFLGKINYNDFLRRYLGQRQGDVIEIETGKKIGTHQGYWFHTIGQRKGLFLGGGPWFVVKKDIEANILYVSHGYDTLLQYGHDFCLRDFHTLTANPFQVLPCYAKLVTQHPDGTATCPITFKVRHTDRWRKGTLTCPPACENDSVPPLFRIQGEERIQGIAPGQFGVVYTPDGKICIGSGEISPAF